MNGEPIPVAVVGAGNMGANHIRVYDELPGADLVEVVEPDSGRAAAVREEYDVEILDDASDISRAAAVTIAVPNRYHRPVARTCARKGLDLLVEKPIANTVEDSRAITEIARENDVVLLVGHIERFNPAIETLQEILKHEHVIEIEAHRLGPFNRSLRRRNVVMDLMIHDLDIVSTIAGEGRSRINGIGRIVRSTQEQDTEEGSLDHAIAQILFENEILGSITASHVTHGKIRTLNVTTQDAYISLNYQTQKITIQRRGTEQTTRFLDRAGYRTETVTETPFVRTREPLKNELEHFLECVRGREEPIVGGDEATDAVELASTVIDRIKGRPE